MLRKTPKYERIAFVASPAPEARKALKRLVKLYGNVTPVARPTSWWRSAATA